MSPGALRIIEDRDEYERGRRDAWVDRAVLRQRLEQGIHARDAYGRGYRQGLRDAPHRGLTNAENCETLRA